MNTPTSNPAGIPAAQAALAALRTAVHNALERKRRLGQYAVVWRGDGPVMIGEDVPTVADADVNTK